MLRREFLQVTAAAVFLPYLARPRLPSVPPPRGWGLSIASQLHADPFVGLVETLTRFCPRWWHDWTWEYSGACPAFWRSYEYDEYRREIDAAAESWTHVLWTNEPELDGGETPAAVADVIARFRVRHPHVKVYGFGCVAGIFNPDTVAEQWLAEYRGPAPDAMHWHIYVRESGEWGKAWDRVRRLSGDLPIVLTEYASPQTGDAQCRKVMDAAAQTLQTDPQLEACAWFCARAIQPEWTHAAMLSAAGETTQIGHHWLAWQTELEGVTTCP